MRCQRFATDAYLLYNRFPAGGRLLVVLLFLRLQIIPAVDGHAIGSFRLGYSYQRSEYRFPGDPVFE